MSRWKFINRVLAVSTWVGIGWFWWPLFYADGADLFLRRWMLVVAVAVIWFDEELGDASGHMSFGSMGYGTTDIWSLLIGPFFRRKIDGPTPALIISIFGWVVLLSPIWMHYLLAKA